MEEIKMNVRNKQLDGSTEVSEVTFTDDNEVKSENSVIPPSGGGGGGSSFLGTLNEDNLLFSFKVSNGKEVSDVNFNLPEDSFNNHLVVIRCVRYEDEYESEQSLALAWLYDCEVSYDMLHMHLSTSLLVHMGNESDDEELVIRLMSLDDEDGTPIINVQGGASRTISFSEYDFFNTKFYVYLLK